MNKKELEKIFDETFWDLWKTDVYNEEWEPLWYINNNDEVKQFIFETIILEVLKSVISHFDEDYNTKKIKLKELYDINL